MNVYIYNADIYCEGCGNAIKQNLTTDCGICGSEHPDIPYVDCRAYRHKHRDDTTEPPDAPYDSDDFPKGPYPDGGGEADCPQHCGNCHAFLENPLTPDGVTYVKEKLAIWKAGRGGNFDVINTWRHFYRDQLRNHRA